MKVFEGLICVDLTSNVAGPYATSILADLGFQVWKVENPEGGDAVRGWPPFADDTSTTFAALNRGKRSVAVDLKTEDGRRVLEALVGTADVVVDSIRPGAFAALGFGWERIQELNPRAVYCSITAYGTVGPLANEPGFDAVVQAYSGLMNLTGEADGPPVRVGTGIIDFGTGLWAVIGVLAALLERSHTNVGSKVECRLLGTAMAFQVHHLASVLMANVIPRRLGTAQHNAAPYQAVTTRDGLVMVAVANESLWAKFCAAVDDGRLAGRQEFATNAERVANRSELSRAIDELTIDRGCAELVQCLRTHGVPASVIRDIGDLPDDPQVQALGLIQDWGDGLMLPVLPIAIGDSTPSTILGVPPLGADTRSVLAELGFTDVDTAALAESGAIALPAGEER